jgi:hypothetical protein
MLIWWYGEKMGVFMAYKSVPIALVIGLAFGCSQDFAINAAVEQASTPNNPESSETTTGDDFAPPVEEEEDPPEEPIDEDPPAEDDCEDTSDLVYVVERDSKTLYLFDPPTLSFTKLGALDCSIYGNPTSMSVSRDGFAYVRYSTDDLYAVELETMNCEATAYDTDFGAFGMGYATQHDKTWRDELFIANKTELAKVDTTSWTVETMGDLPSQSELTGNADGELWAFLPLETPAALVQLDKTNGAEMDWVSIDEFPNPANIDTFAFATWGGDFWLFVRSYGMGESTDVFRVTKSGSIDKVKNNVGLNIVGAGVSTCAPTD